MVSIPSESGVTSSNKTSFTSPVNTAPWIAAPTATTSSGFTPLLGLRPKNFSTISCTFGILVLPPTRITSSMSSPVTAGAPPRTRRPASPPVRPRRCARSGVRAAAPVQVGDSFSCAFFVGCACSPHVRTPRWFSDSAARLRDLVRTAPTVPTDDTRLPVMAPSAVNVCVSSTVKVVPT